MLLDPDSLPENQAARYRRVCSELGVDVALLDVTTDLGVPTVLAYRPPGQERPVHGRGLGTSLSEHLAIDRALNELLQTETLGDTIPPEQVRHLGDLDPNLLRCAEFDLTSPLRLATTRPCLAEAHNPGPVREQLRQVLRAIGRRGYTAYGHTPELGTDLLSLVHIVVPGLERIMTLLQGHPALPGPRGLETITEGTPA